MAGDRKIDVNISKRQRFERLRAELETEASTFKTHWKELGRYILPNGVRDQVSQNNIGTKRYNSIIDSTASMAVRTLQSGMMTGVTSPARPWFRLTTPDKDLADQQDVKEWLFQVEERIRTVFLRSNLYQVLPSVYGQLGVFGTAAMSMEDDPVTFVRFKSYPIASYWIANDSARRVNTFYKEFRMTVMQIVEEYGMREDGTIDWTNISDNVKNLYENKNQQAWISVAHAIMPNDNYDPKSPLNKHKKYMSAHYELGYTGQGVQGPLLSSDAHGKILRESGFDDFPIFAIRWETVGEDVYGTDSPGMLALGDVKQLQTAEKRGLQALDKQINPPMTGPTSLRNQKTSILPGDITYVDESQGRGGFRAAHEVNFNLQALEVKQQQVRERIRRAFFEDLFLMISNSDRRQITATEIDERREEKLLAIGPVLERLNQDLLSPLIDAVFNKLVEFNLLPQIPESLQNLELKVEFISIMHQAQKLVGVGGIERFTNYVAGISQVKPDSLDKINSDELVDTYGELMSVPPGLIKSEEEVVEIRAQRQAALQRQQQMEQAQQAAQMAKTVSEIPQETEGSGLADIRRQVTGV